MRLFIGLGNPGEEYKNTYHNVGKLAVEFLAGNDGWDQTAYFAYKKIDGVIYATLKTFMNESGGAVKEILRFFNVTPNDIVVLHDDSDLSIGEYKTTESSSAAGHKGVQSIIDVLGTQDFTRIRIGIRSPEENNGEVKRKKAEDFVLKPISKKHLEILYGVFGELKAKRIENVTP